MSTTSTAVAGAGEGWTAKTAVTAYGVRVGVRTDDAALLAKLTAYLPPASVRSPFDQVDLLYSVERRGGSGYIGYAGTEPFVETTDEAMACWAFESRVHVDVAAATTTFVFVHAGVVGWKGAAILIPGLGMIGKSRLVDALVRAGATYYSDDCAVIDQDGCVHPYRIPINLRENGGVRRVKLPGLSAEDGPLPIGLIVSTTYEHGVTWQPRRVTPGEALLILLSTTIRARLAPAQVMKVLARVAEDAVTVEGPRGDADPVAPLILKESR